MSGSRLKALLYIFVLSAGFMGCSFNYGDTSDDEELALPDMVMQNFEYVRVRGNSIQARLQGDRAERYEKKQSMLIEQLRFAQYAQSDAKAKAVGLAGKAKLNLASGDVDFSDGVQIVVAGEGLTIETQEISWYDKDRILLAPDEIPVLIKKEDGSILTGKAFGADARRRSWEFANTFTAQYIDDQKPAPASGETASAGAASPASGITPADQAAGAVKQDGAAPDKVPVAGSSQTEPPAVLEYSPAGPPPQEIPPGGEQ